jgi:hypothetical protein
MSVDLCERFTSTHLPTCEQPCTWSLPARASSFYADASVRTSSRRPRRDGPSCLRVSRGSPRSPTPGATRTKVVRSNLVRAEEGTATEQRVDFPRLPTSREVLAQTTSKTRGVKRTRLAEKREAEDDPRMGVQWRKTPRWAVGGIGPSR